MADWKELWRRIWYLARRSRFQSELSDELRFHLECRIEELESKGVSGAAARAQARREFGSVTKAADDTHEAWRIRWLDDLAGDLRYAARALRRNPGFAVAAVLCLALGIGANTTIFSITTSCLLSVPSGRDPARLVSVWEGGNSASPLGDYKFMRSARVFEGTAGINPETEVNWRNSEQSARLFNGAVTDDYFTTLGVPMLMGRGIEPGESDTVVLSYRLWTSRMAGDPGVIGHPMVLDGRTYTIVGVLPKDHRTVVGLGYSPDVYVPVSHDGDLVQFYARLPKGMTIPVARQRLRAVFQELDRVRPTEMKRAGAIGIWGVTGMGALAEEGFAPLVAFFGMLALMVGLVLLIACTNVAGLLLARASSRSQELAVRLSLGASRARIVRHLLAESLLLATLGAAAGLILNAVCASLISNWTLPIPLPIQVVITPDWRLVAYSLFMVLLSALISGLMPALKAVRKDVNSALKRGPQQVERVWGLRGALVAGQVAVTTLLLATGFLFLHNLLQATSMNPGFDTNHTLWAQMRLVPEAYRDKGRQTALVRDALERLRNMPGVQAAAITRRVPLNDNCLTSTDLRPDSSSAAKRMKWQCNNVGPDYFRAIGIPVLRGREFTAREGKGSQVAIVNETFARQMFGSIDAVGHTFTGPTALTIVGVVKDSKYFTLGEQQKAAVYEPYFAYDEPENLSFIVRATGPPSGFVKPLEELLGRLDSAAAIEVKPMSRALGFALLPSQAGAAALGAMGLLGLALAATGLYGILLYTVERRAREIGLRVALGATPAAILRMVCSHSFGLAGAGLAIGLGLAIFGTRPLAMFLVPGLSATDPAAFGAVIAVLGAVAVLATVTPAMRALRADPMAALRYE